MPDYLNPLLDIMSKQAGIDDTRAQTQQRLQAVQMNQQNMAKQKRIDDLMMRRAEEHAGKKDVPDMVTMDDGTMIPANMNNPLVQIAKSIQKNTERAKELADDAYWYGDPKAAQQANKEWFDQQKELRQAQVLLYKDMLTRNKENVQTLGGVHSYEDFQHALKVIAANDGQAAVDKMATEFDKILPNAKTASDAEIRAAVAPITNRETTMGEQLRKQAADTASQDRRNTMEENIRHHYEDEALARSRNARSRDGIDLAERKFEYAKGHRDERDIIKDEKDGQRELTTNKAVDSFYKVKKSYEAAENVANVLEKNGFRSVTGTEAATIMNEYSQMVNNYRSMVGGKWTVTQQKNYDSMFAKLSGYVQSVGVGKIYSEEALRGVAAEMNRMYQDTNIEVLKKTLQVRDKVWRRQGDPMSIDSPASTEQALRQPGVDQVTDPETGVKYIRFGPNAEDVFPVRDKPKPRPKAPVYGADDEEEE